MIQLLGKKTSVQYKNNQIGIKSYAQNFSFTNNRSLRKPVNFWDTWIIWISVTEADSSTKCSVALFQSNFFLFSNLRLHIAIDAE